MFEQRLFEQREAPFRYLRTSDLLRAHVVWNLPDSTKVLFFGENESELFIHAMRQKNVVARLGGLNNNYLRRAAELANRTVIEVTGRASPETMLTTGERSAELVEQLAIISTVLVTRRNDLQRKLGISGTTASVNLAVSSGFKRIRARSRRVATCEGVTVNRAFCTRFEKCGFNQLLRYLQSEVDLAKRVRTSSNWLRESRSEAKLGAAVVKSAISLESLLVFAESESLARTLSERSAFILSNSPATRRAISGIVLRFYDARSGVVHGSQKKAKKLTPALLEAVDRLILLLHLVIASNAELWPNVESLRVWCESQRWDKPFSSLKFPLSRKYLNNALKLVAAD